MRKMASRVLSKQDYFMLKNFSSLIFVLLFMTACQKVESQKNKEIFQTDKSAVTSFDDSEFYSPRFLKSDLEQVEVVVYVNVLSRELADQITNGSCEKNEGPGYCLYLLKANVNEVFKGKIEKKDFEFYTVTDADYKNKDSLLGEKVVFLNRSDNYPNKKMNLGTLENSTRLIKHDVLEKLKKISKEN